MLTIKDFSNALYALGRAKGYAATVIITLAVTLGTLLATFNLNYTLIAAPLPYADEDRLIVSKTPYFVNNERLYDDGAPMQLLPVIYQRDKTTFENTALVGYSYTGMSLRDKADSPKILIAYTTPGYMQMFQMPILHGRAFSADEDLNTHTAVAILSEHIWRKHYNADPAMVGKNIQVAQHQFKVIGIAAESFVEPRLIGPNRSNDLWLPWDFNPDPCVQGLIARSCMVGWHFMLGKLKAAGQHQQVAQQLSAELNALFKDSVSDSQAASNDSITFEAQPLRQTLVGDSESKTLWLFVGSLVLLCIASANTLNLVLARAVRQQRSMAIQAALGAQKKHIFIHVFAEMLILLLLTLLFALAVAHAQYQLLQQVAEIYLPRVTELQLNLPTLLFATMMTLSLGCTFAYLVVRQINYRFLNRQLQSSGKGSGLQISALVRQLLIISQVTLTAVLLVACMMVMQQAIGKLNQYIGFNTDRIYQVDLDELMQEIAPENMAARRLEKKRELTEIRDLLAQHPAVSSASVANYAPANFDGVYGSGSWYKSAEETDENLVMGRVTDTDPNFLPMFDIKILSGRNFTPQEFTENTAVLLVNQSFANTVWPNQQAVGQRLYGARGRTWDVIGVVPDFNLTDQYSATEPLRAFSARTTGDYGGTLLFKLKPGMHLTKTEMNNLLTQVSPRYRTAEIFSLEQNVKTIQFADYLAAGVTMSLSAITVFLAAVGIYGVLSYSVQLRRYELGVRMAIGARPVTILMQLLRENIKPVLIGFLASMLLLVVLWFAVQASSFKIELSAQGFLLPFLMILLLTTIVSLLSVWSVIRKPAIYALRT
jgi:predicted permease